MAYGKLTYLALKKETTEGTPVTPDVYIEYINESLLANYESTYVPSAAGSRSKMYHAVNGKNGPPGGTIKLPVQAKTIGHILKGLYGSLSTGSLTDSTYTHTFSEGTTTSIPSYTIDIGISDLGYVFRFYGCKFGNGKFYFEDNYMCCDADVQARGAFTVTEVVTTASSGTSLIVKSTAGIVTGNTVTVSYGDANDAHDYTVTVASETELTLGAAISGDTHTAGDLVVIKTATPSYSIGSQFHGVGGSQFNIGTVIGSVAARDAEDWTFEFGQELEARHAFTGTNESDRWPVANLVKGYEAKTSFKWYHSDPTYINHLRDREHLATTFVSTGDLVGATTRDSLTFQMPHIRINSYLPSVGADDIIEEDIEATCVYDITTGYVTKAVLVNAVTTY